MRRPVRRAIGIAACVVLSSVVGDAQGRRPSEWLTWGGDGERSGTNPGETVLSKQTVGKLALKWRVQIDKEVPLAIESGGPMLTTPLVAQAVRTAAGPKTVLYTLAPSNTLAALDAANGAVIWQVTFENSVPPASAANWVCTNTSIATPVIDKSQGLIYAIAGDGRLHALDIASGKPKVAPAAFVPPYSRNWSLNLRDGVMYTTVGRGCGNVTPDATGATAPRTPPVAAAAGTIPPAGGQTPAAAAAPPAGGTAETAAVATGAQPPAGRGAAGAGAGEPRTPRAAVASQMVAMEIGRPDAPVARFTTSGSRPSGAWTRAGMAWGFDSLYVLTADGAWDPAKGLWGQTLLRLKPRTLEMLDYFTPTTVDELNTKDLDYSSGGTLAFTHQNRDLVFSAGKDGVVYLHEAKSLGGADHRTPLFSLKVGNDAMMYASTGVWGAPATVVNARNERWIYLPMWGPPSVQATFARSNGEAKEGSIMAFQVVVENKKPALAPKWVSRNLAVPESPIVANGVVYALSTGENTIQRHTDPRYHELYQKPGAPPLPKLGILTAEERGQNVTHATLYAFDADTGAELYSSKDLIDDWTHLSGISVADGSVYVTTRKSYVYAFGLK